MVQVDYLRVGVLDIGASKSDNLRDHHFRARLQNSSLQPWVREVLGWVCSRKGTPEQRRYRLFAQLGPTPELNRIEQALREVR